MGADSLGEWYKLMHRSRKVQRRGWESETNLVWLEHRVGVQKLRRRMKQIQRERQRDRARETKQNYIEKERHKQRKC